MSRIEIILTILIAILGTVFTRAISSIIFRNPEKIPRFVKYLGTVLPFAVMGLLVVFSYKDISFSRPDIIILKIIASLVVIFLHIFKRNMLLSIAGGTGAYVCLLKIFN